MIFVDLDLFTLLPSESHEQRERDSDEKSQGNAHALFVP